jgi:hypothetical protein
MLKLEVKVGLHRNCYSSIVQEAISLLTHLELTSTEQEGKVSCSSKQRLAHIIGYARQRPAKQKFV